jgi:hypothetical protein
MVFRVFTSLTFCIFFITIAGSQPVRNARAIQTTAKKLHGVFKNGDTLTVYLRNGKIKWYINKQHEDETYLFKGLLAHTQYFLFRFEYRSGEVSGFLLVNEINGSQCSVPGKPLLSPDNKRFATSCIDLEAQYNPNSLTIYRLDKDSCRMEYSMEPKDWGAAKLKWLNNSSLQYQNVVRTETGIMPAGKSVLQLKKKHWLLKE